MAIKVSQDVINEIKKKGMAASIAQANSGNASAEFTEGAKRMYGNRVTSRESSNANTAEKAKVSGSAVPSVGDKKAPSTEGKPVTMPPSAPASAARSVQKNAPGSSVLGAPNAKAIQNVGSKLTSVQQGVNTKDGGDLIKGVLGGIRGLYRKQTHASSKRKTT